MRFNLVGATGVSGLGVTDLVDKGVVERLLTGFGVCDLAFDGFGVVDLLGVRLVVFMRCAGGGGGACFAFVVLVVGVVLDVATDRVLLPPTVDVACAAGFDATLVVDLGGVDVGCGVTDLEVGLGCGVVDLEEYIELGRSGVP